MTQADVVWHKPSIDIYLAGYAIRWLSITFVFKTLSRVALGYFSQCINKQQFYS